MKKLRWQILVVLLALAAIAFLLLSQQQELLPGIVPPQETPQPVTGGIYKEALIGSFGRLNPVLDAYNPVDHDIDRLIYSGLIRFDDRGVPRPDLAESWGISQDGKVYNFAIRPDAVWHDGEPLTSDDFLFTAELMRDEVIPLPSDVRAFWSQVDVKILDEKTIQFRLPEPFAPFMDYLSFGVLPKHKLDSLTSQEIIEADFNLNPVGTGPFRFDRLVVEDGVIKGVVLEAFEEYYSQRPYVDQVVFLYYPDAPSALAAYRSGEVIAISQISPDILADALKEPALDVFTGRLPRLTMLYLNLGDTSLPFFQDANVRKALLQGVNRQWMVDRLLGGQGIVADGPILPGTWAYYDGVQHLEFDTEAATDLLKQAGYTFPAEGGSVRAKDGVGLAFELVYPDEGVYPQIAETIQRNWKLMGVEITLKPVPYDVLVQQHLETRNYQAALVDLNLARSPDPDPYPFWHQTQGSSGQNYARWDDRQASEYLEQARVLDDLTERARRYRNFQVRFMNEMPALPLFYPVYSYGVSEDVKGVRVGPMFDPSDRFATISAWFFNEGQSDQVQILPTETEAAVAEE
jgi:peptide/nickel transport system substrate-binding protein